MGYDPGTPNDITHVRDRIYKVRSFRGADAEYEVDLDQRSCTCPHFTDVLVGTSGICKHMKYAEGEERNFRLLQKARKLKNAELETCLRKYHSIYSALRAVQQERQLAEKRDADMKAVFS